MSGKRRAETELTRDNWDEEDEPQEKGVFRRASTNDLKNRVIKTARRRVTSSGASDSEQKSLFSGFNAFANNVDSKKPFSFSSSLTKDSKPTVSLPVDNSQLMSGDLNSDNSESKISAISDVKPNQLSFPGSNLDSDKCELTNNQNKLSKLSNDLKKTASVENFEEKKDDKPGLSDRTADEIFRQKLRSLNLLCAEWIIKHLNENLSYILTPIFDDYKKHLTQLREDLKRANSNTKMPRLEISDNLKPTSSSVPIQNNFKASDKVSSENKISPFSSGNKVIHTFKFDPPSGNKPVLNFNSSTQLKNETPKINFFANKIDSGLFKFSADQKKTSTDDEPGAKPLSIFSSTNNPQIEGKSTSLFSSKPTDEIQSKPTSTFSFNAGVNTTPASPFFSPSSFPETQKQKTEAATNETDEYRPPVAEDIAITEEGSVYDKKCKVFIKKDGTFVDHGVGFLFLKLVGDEKKCQIIVRANNKLANIIINVLLSSNVPVKKMEKNNVMIISCPTPEIKQPTSILIKVKTAEDADELFEALNKYRK